MVYLKIFWHFHWYRCLYFHFHSLTSGMSIPRAQIYWRFSIKRRGGKALSTVANSSYLSDP
jgi:hypothetical protein